MAAKRIDYNYINARLHGLISKILTEKDMQNLDRAGSVTELLHLLKDTAYAQLSPVYETTGDTKMVELELFTYQKQVYDNLAKHVPEPLLPLLQAFQQDHTDAVLTSALRLWFDQNMRKRPIGDFVGYIPEGISWNGITPLAIIHAKDKETLLQLLRKAGFCQNSGISTGRSAVGTNVGTNTSAGDLTAEIEDLYTTKQLYFLETAIDRIGVERFLRVLKNFNDTDQTLLRNLLGKEIDVRNVIRLLRNRELYTQVPKAGGWDGLRKLLYRGFLPGGEKVPLEQLERTLQNYWRDPATRVEKVRPTAGTGSGSGGDTLFSSTERTNRQQELSVVDISPPLIALYAKAGILPPGTPVETSRQDGGRTLQGAASSSVSAAAPGNAKRSSRLDLMLSAERTLQKQLVQAARKSKSGDPFTVGILAAYIILKKQEITWIRSLIHAKQYGLAWKEVSQA